LTSSARVGAQGLEISNEVGGNEVGGNEVGGNEIEANEVGGNKGRIFQIFGRWRLAVVVSPDWEENENGSDDSEPFSNRNCEPEFEIVN
jgi:hypothetical protein